jgi:hypothetical protein
MRVGVTGHQKREGIDWRWVSRAVDAELELRPTIELAVSSLAEGADQVFARCAIEHHIPVLAVIPIDNYASYFEAEALLEYRSLLTQSKCVDLGLTGDPETAFLQAGRYIVEHVELLFAIWDGKRAAGRGGTADIVTYAQQRDCPIIHIDPIAQTIKPLHS